MLTTAGCRLQLDVSAEVELQLSVAVASGHRRAESLAVTVDGAEVPVREVRAPHGTRLHLATVQPGSCVVSYDVVVEPGGDPREVTDVDRIVAVRPSRYCPSDLMLPLLADLRGAAPEDVRQWVHDRLVYDGFGSRPVDSALDTMLTGRGVCRDYAHLLVAALRAVEVPARVVSVYAPGLSPMDFHAVVEAAVDGVWQLLDATGLAPRPAMLRIATGQDAADTAFLTSANGSLTLASTEIWASTDADLPADAPTALP